MEEKKYKIEYDRNECIGAGECVSIAPENWYFDEDKKAAFRKEEFGEKEFEKNMSAALACPVNCIHIIDKKTGEKKI